jgi:hypothetical protein
MRPHTKDFRRHTSSFYGLLVQPLDLSVLLKQSKASCMCWDINNASVQFLTASVPLLVFSICLASEKPVWGDVCVALLPTCTGCVPKQILTSN